MPEQETRADIDPQLAKTMNPAKFKWDHSWNAEPKLDGLRCIVMVEPMKPCGVAAYSRNGKPLWNMQNILFEVAKTNGWPKWARDGFVLDGEVYTKDWNLSMSIVKRSTQSHELVDQLRYHVWDCLTLKEWESRGTLVSNHERRQRLFALLKDPHYIQTIESTPVSNAEELQQAYLRFLEQGYEGAILKNPLGPYKLGRRSPDWLKIKPWFDADLRVVGCYPGEGKHLGRIGGLVLEGSVEWRDHSVDVHTEVGTGFTDEEREFFQGLHDSDKLSGKIVEIKYQEITVDGACRFPVYNRLREDKE